MRTPIPRECCWEASASESLEMLASDPRCLDELRRLIEGEVFAHEQRSSAGTAVIAINLRGGSDEGPLIVLVSTSDQTVLIRSVGVGWLKLPVAA